MAGPAAAEGQRLTDSGLAVGRTGEGQPGFEKAQKPCGQSQWGLRSTLDASWFWVFTDSHLSEKKPKKGALHRPPNRLLLLSHSSKGGGGRSSSSSFSRYVSGCTSETSFFLAKIWLISMNVLALVSGMIRHV